MASLKTYQFRILPLHFLLSFFQVAAPESTGFTLQLIPWDSPKSPLYQPNLTQTQQLHMMVMSSRTRAVVPTPDNRTFYTNAIKIPNEGLRYSVNIKIGSPSKEVTLLLDTGSGPIWTLCKQSRSDYNPLKSRTHKELPCEHPLCLKSTICKCIKGRCVCSLMYGLKGAISKVVSVLSSDSFTLPMKKNRLRTFPNMVFGCSDKSPIYSGILGMDKFAGSLISQVSNVIRGRYSYCLYRGGGSLSFGNDIPQIGKDAKTTMILHPKHPALFLDLTDISVGRKRLGLSPDLFTYKQGGFIIDTGGPFTVLKTQAYNKVIQEFAIYYKGRLQRVNGTKYNLDLCYKNNASMKSYASMTFHLKGADYETSNMFFIPKPGIMCIGLIPGEISILGALQQWNTRFIFDLKDNVLSFVSEDCSKDRG